MHLKKKQQKTKKTKQKKKKKIKRSFLSKVSETEFNTCISLLSNV